MKRAAPLLLLLCSCSFFGSMIRETGAATGAAAGALAGPAGAAAGAVIGGIAGEMAAEATTQTAAVRVPVLPAPQAAASASHQGTTTSTTSNDMDLVTIGLLAALIFLGRELFALKAKDAEQQKQLDDLWDRIAPKP